MKINTNVKQSFKVVRQTQVDRLPELADRLGKKRAEVIYSVPEYEAADIAELANTHGELVATCLNNAIVELAKQQFVANASNWDFAPNVESLSLDALKASFESVTRGRVLTLESAGKLAAWLQTNLAKITTGIQAIDAAYTATQASAIIAVIAKYTAYEAKGADYLAKVTLRLEQISEAIAGNDELAESFVETPELAAVFDALMRKFAKSIEDEVSEDAL